MVDTNNCKVKIYPIIIGERTGHVIIIYIIGIPRIQAVLFHQNIRDDSNMGILRRDVAALDQRILSHTKLRSGVIH